MTNKLLIVWSTEEIEVAKKMILLYSSVMLERGYWDEASIMIWGPSARLISQNTQLQNKIKEIAKTGVKFQACVVCTDEYGVSKTLKGLGIELIHTGEVLTQALQGDWKVLTF
ncbi:DsrE family protein [Sulfurimonas sp. MAG313]|nr:DsrE family protein [Sulfurimonas sp. MAG313]MDF1881624.1 DsrE family protein [Sulfurimonas sp. MAG313]